MLLYRRVSKQTSKKLNSQLIVHSGCNDREKKKKKKEIDDIMFGECSRRGKIERGTLSFAVVLSREYARVYVCEREKESE